MRPRGLPPAVRALRTVERDRESDDLADELDRLIADKRDG